MTTVIDLDARKLDRLIGATVRALLSARRTRPDLLGEHLGISRNAVYEKLAGRAPFKASEVAYTADYLGVTINDLYDGLGGRITPPTPGAPLNSGWRSHRIRRSSHQLTATSFVPTSQAA